MSDLVFAIPGQPYGKGRPRIGKVGKHARMFTPEKTVAYESTVALFAHQAMQGRALITAPVSVAMVLVFGIPDSWPKKKRAQAQSQEIWPTTKPDMDNVVKAVFDAINGVVWKDDVQVVNLAVSKSYGDQPAVHVVVTPMEAA
jgi:Holliday junction resolvase RusA-like endonuclease